MLTAASQGRADLIENYPSGRQGRLPEFHSKDSRDDSELLVAALTDPAAFGCFYHRHFKNIIGYFSHRVHDHADSIDLASETFTAALQNLDQFSPRRGNATQWLYGIASNLLHMFWRNNQAPNRARLELGVNTPGLPTTGWDEIATATARLDAGRLSAALDRIPFLLRTAVRLRVIDQLDYREIGTAVGCRPATARVRVMRGLRELRVEFDDPKSSATP